MQKRVHTKSHGVATFRELSRSTSIAWRAGDKPTLDYCAAVAAILKARHRELKSYMAAVNAHQNYIKGQQNWKQGLTNQSKSTSTSCEVVKPATVVKRKVSTHYRPSPYQVLIPSKKSKLSWSNNEGEVHPAPQKTSSIQPRSSSGSEIPKASSTDTKPVDSTPNVHPSKVSHPWKHKGPTPIHIPEVGPKETVFKQCSQYKNKEW